MKFFKKLPAAILFAALASGVCPCKTLAASMPVNITYSGGAFVNYAPGSDLGTIAGRADLSDASVYSWMLSDVTAANNLPVRNIPLPTTTMGGTPFGGSLFSTTTLTLDLTGRFDYVFLHWDDSGLIGSVQAFYVGGLVGEVTFDDPLSPGVNRVPQSLVEYYGPVHAVPESFATLSLLASALAGMAALGRIHAVKKFSTTDERG